MSIKYLAVALDFDGTVTDVDVPVPSQETAKLLKQVAEKVPLAFCTGRDFSSFEKHALGILLEKIPENERYQFLENLFIMGENGAIGYVFDKKKGAFVEFYKIPWPSKIIPKAKLAKIIGDKIGGIGELINKHEIVLVTRSLVNSKDYRNADTKKIYENAKKIEKIVETELRKIVKNYEKYFYIGNAGIGVIVGPKEGNKDNGVLRFAKCLRIKRGLKIGAKAREIICIGDRPLKNGNDFYLLNGKIGTPFTVGDFDKKKKFPKPVLDENGKRLKHTKATSYLLRNIFLSCK